MKPSSAYREYFLLAIALSLFLVLAATSSAIVVRNHSTLLWLVNDPIGLLNSPADIGSTIWQLVLLVGACAGMALALWSLASLLVVEIALTAHRCGVPIQLGRLATSSSISPLVRRLFLRRLTTAATVITIGLSGPATAGELPDEVEWPTTSTSASVSATISSPIQGTEIANTHMGRGTDSSYIVRSGDSLWTIAARHLDTDEPTRIDAYWREIYRLNQQAIGTRPDYIIPGMRLRLPKGND